MAAALSLLLPGTVRADPSPSVTAKQAEARQVMAQIDALNANLTQAGERVNLANLRLAEVQHSISFNRREIVVASRNLVRSRQIVADRLVALYTTASTSSLDVIVGAQSLDDVLQRVDAEDRISSVDAKIAKQVVRYRDAVILRKRQLAIQQRRVKQLVATRAREKQSIESQLGERRALLSSVNSEVQRLIAAEQARQAAASLAARAQASSAQSQQAAAFSQTAVGASAQAETATIVPPSSHGGVVGAALSELGVPYVWAGSSPGGFDCSGLVMYAYSRVGVSLPHSSYAMYSSGVGVARDQLQPGDLVFFDGLGHVGIYIGGGQFVHSPHTGTVVQVSDMSSGYYLSNYVGARRIL